MLVLAVARPELREEHPDIAAGGPWVTLDLHPLSAGETKRLVGFLGGAAAAEIEPAVAERCGGNPFFTEELVRLPRERSLLRPASPSDAQEAAETVLPDSLAALVAARLDALDPDLKGVLADAAVVGQTFWPGALAAAGDTDRRVVDRRLRELAKREFVRRTPVSSLAGEAEYAFWHGLTREVAYAALPRGARAAKHAAVASWIESSEQKAVAAAEILAHHYESALGLAEAAGESELAGRLTEPTVRALWTAGDRALPLDVAVAERHYRHALGLCPRGPRSSRASWSLTGSPCSSAGTSPRLGRRSNVVCLAFARPERSGPKPSRPTGLPTRSGCMATPRAIEVAAHAAALLEDEPPSAEQVKVMADWAAMCAASYESETGIALADRALDLCRDLRLPVSVRALGWRGLARSHFGDVVGLDDMRRALGLAKRQGLGRYAAMLYSNLADAVLTFHGPKVALRLYREGVEFTGGRGDQMSMIGLQAEEAAALFWAGRWDAALALAGEVEEPLAAAGQILDLVSIRSMLTGVLTARGQAAGPAVQAVLTWARGREFADRGNAIDLLGALADAYSSLGEHDEALKILTRVAEVRESITSCPQFGLTLPAQLRMAAALGDLSLARRLAAKTVASRALDRHTLVLLLALEAEHESRLKQAAQHYAEAASRWRAFGAPYEEAQALLGQGRCLVALGRGDDASMPLRRGARVFKRLGAAPALSQTLRLLGPRTAERARGARD